MTHRVKIDFLDFFIQLYNFLSTIIKPDDMKQDRTRQALTLLEIHNFRTKFVLVNTVSAE